MASSNPPELTAQPDGTFTQHILMEKARTNYVNFCRGTLTPEEVVLDFGFNANGFGVKVLEENIDVTNRIILSPATAKRLLFQLNEMVRRHEQNFGELEMDFRRRLKVQPQAENNGGPIQ